MMLKYCQSFIYSIILLIDYINTGGQMNTKKPLFLGIAIAAVLIIVAGAAIFLTNLSNSTNEEATAVISADSVEFTGMYGATYEFSDILEISLDDTIPAAGYKYDGSGLGEVKKGDWEVEGLGRCRLFVMSKNGPFVVMRTTDRYVIVNFKDSEKTKELYNNLLEAVK